MTCKMSLLTCIIALLLSISVSGELYKLTGSWLVEIQKCRNEGKGYRNYEYQIGSLGSFNLLYRQFHKQTHITAGTNIELETAASGVFKLSSVDLDYYTEEKNHKSYATYYGRGGVVREGQQMAEVTLEVSIYKNGTIVFKHNVAAESWQADDCASSRSLVNFIIIDV